MMHVEDEPHHHERVFGEHRAWTNAIDAVFVEWNGDVRAADIRVISELVRTFTDTAKQLVLVQNVKRLKRFSSDARAQILEEKDSQRFGAIVVVGAEFHFRMVMGLISRAMRLIHRANAPFYFVPTHDDALAFIGKSRTHPTT